MVKRKILLLPLRPTLKPRRSPAQTLDSKLCSVSFMWVRDISHATTSKKSSLYTQATMAPFSQKPL